MHIYHRASDVNLKPIDNIQRIYDVSYSSKHIHKHIILKFAFTLFAHKLFLVPHIQLKVEKVYTFLFQSFIHSILFYSANDDDPCGCWLLLFCWRSVGWLFVRWVHNAQDVIFNIAWVTLLCQKMHTIERGCRYVIAANMANAVFRFRFQVLVVVVVELVRHHRHRLAGRQIVGCHIFLSGFFFQVDVGK